ncbi:hypothetical protein C8F04DRAFT_1240908 [Mycena alexandri]|uniref:Uncharacterized protein n=1 Tax=Mycena alexandri TaxID=1745969 RepID=A0AAD6S870_9AGAR|nr:hypothetical protein C8F04DRAFT_1240908 [Mycena alexandri]
MGGDILQRRGNIVLLVTAIALFTLSTIIVILALILGAARIDDVDLPVPELLFAANIIFGVNNVIADGLVIYRCYCVWNYNGYVVIVPILSLIATSLFGLDLDLPAKPFYGLSLATNILVNMLTAGRIWWIYREARMCLKTDMQKKYLSSLAILVESGVLYSATVLAFLILVTIVPTRISTPAIYQMLAQIMGIAPTLIIVRVGLGVSVQNVEITVKAAVTMTSETHVRPISPPGSLDKSAISVPKDVEQGDLDSNSDTGFYGPRCMLAKYEYDTQFAVSYSHPYRIHRVYIREPTPRNFVLLLPKIPENCSNC